MVPGLISSNSFTPSCVVNLHTTKDGSTGGNKLRWPSENAPAMHGHQPSTYVKANRYIHMYYN